MPGAAVPPANTVPPDTTNKELGSKIQKAGIVVLAAQLCVRLAGLVGKNIIPNYYDTGGNTLVADVFSHVNGSVLYFPFILGEQCLAPAFLPVFTRAKTEQGEVRAWRYASILFNFLLVMQVAVVAAFICYPDFFGRLLTSWSPTDPDPKNASRYALFVRMLPYAAPSLIGLSMASLTYVILTGYKKFFFAALGDVPLKLSIVGGAALGGLAAHWSPDRTDWRYIAGGAVAGGTLKFLTHLVALGWKRLRMFQFSFNLGDPYVRAFFALALPLLGGIVVSQVRDQIIRREITVLPNLPTYYDLGTSLTGTIQILVPYTLSIALLPYFCDLSARDDNARLGALLTSIIRLLIWFFVPVSIACATGALPLCEIFFSGKNLQQAQLIYPALVISLFALQLPFVAIEMMVMQAFFSSKRVIAPTIAGVIFSVLTAAVVCAGIEYKLVTTPQGVLTLVALSLVVSRMLKAVLLIAMLRWTLPVLPVAETLSFVARAAVAGIASFALAYGASKLIRGEGRIRNVAQIGAVGVAAFGTFIAVSLALRLDEPKQFARWTMEKLRRRGKK